MDRQKILSNLCSYDRRNPDYIEEFDQEEDNRKPRTDCFCDNCFYGRDTLALEILRLLEGEENG